MTDYTKIISGLVPQLDGESAVRHRSALVDAVNANGTVDLDFNGTIIASVSVLDGAVVGAGETVQVAVWAGDMLVLGAARTAPSGARGILDYAEVTSSQLGMAAGTTDLTGLAVTVTVGTGRAIEISGNVQLGKRTAAGRGQVLIREGSSNLGRLWRIDNMATSGTLQRFRGHGSAVIFPSAGSHTYKLSAETSSNIIDAEAAGSGEQNWIMVEDIGAA